MKPLQAIAQTSVINSDTSFSFKTHYSVKSLTKVRLINMYVITFMLIVLSSRASTVAKSDITLIVLGFYSFILNIFQRNIQHYIMTICKITAFFIAFVFIYFIKNNQIDAYTWIGFYTKTIFAFNAVHYCKDNFLPVFIKLVYWLCLISLPLFAFQLISFDTLFPLNNLFGAPSTRGLEPNSNSILFNLQTIHKFRNSGFMWEPGAFAAVIVLALLFAFKFYDHFNLQKYIFIFCILTTFSTTGYIATFIIFIYFSYQKLKSVSLFLTLPLCIVLLNVNFVTKKIQDQLNDIEDELLLTQFSGEYNIHLNRFASFYVDYNTFIENPIIGMGVDVYSTGKNVFYKEYDENVVRTSGLMLSLVKVGLFGMSIFLFMLNKRIRTRFRDKRYAYLFSVILVLLLFSNPLEFSTVFLCLLFI